jgi:hypothetical protein
MRSLLVGSCCGGPGPGRKFVRCSGVSKAESVFRVSTGFIRIPLVLEPKKGMQEERHVAGPAVASGGQLLRWAREEICALHRRAAPADTQAPLPGRRGGSAHEYEHDIQQLRA